MVEGKIRVKKTGQHVSLSFYSPKIVVDSRQNPLAKWSEYIREKVRQTYTFSLDNDLKGLLIRMVFGIQQNMSTTFLQALRISGVMHVIATSRMNITFIAGLLLAIFQKFSYQRMHFS